MRLSRACVALAVLSAVAAPAPAAEETFAVRYRSASTVYLDGGRAQGLAPGDRLTVRGVGGPAGELEVVFVAEQSASCRVVSETRPIRPGDAAVRLARTPAPSTTPSVARPVPAAPAAAAPLPPAPRPSAPPVAAVPFARYRGGASFGYYRVQDAGGGVLGSEQRTGDLDFRAWDIAGQPLSFGARLRLRRDARPSGAALRDDRVHELSLRYEPPSGPLVLEAGRIGGSGWGSIGTLDGVMGQVRVLRPVHLGGFYGRRADVGPGNVPAAGLRYGAFLRFAPAGAGSGSYDVLLGGVREMENGEASREYLNLESRFNAGTRWSLYERAELDLNRGWRLALTGRRYQLSNVSVSTTLRFGSAHWAALSYDSRQGYRDQANRTVPEAVFDDAIHQGLRASLYLGSPRGLNVALNGGGRLGEAGGRRSWSYGGALRHGDLFGLALTASVDASFFSNGYTDGWQLTGQAGRSFAAGHYLDATYGLSRYRARADGTERETRWVRGSGRIQLVGGLYVLGDVEYSMGDDFKGPRVLLETGYRF